MINFAEKNKSVFVGVVFFAMLGALIPVLNILVKQILVDGILIHREKLLDSFVLCIVIIGINTIIQVVAAMSREKFLYKVRVGYAEKAVKSLIKKNNLDLFSAQQAEGLNINTVINQHVEALIDGYFSGMLDLIVIVVVSLFAYIYAFMINWQIALFSLAFMVACYYVNLWGGKLISDILNQNAKSTTTFITAVENYLSNFRVIKNYELGPRIIKKFDRENEIYASTYLALKNRLATFNTFNAVLYLLQKLTIIVLGGFAFYYKTISPGELISVIYLSSMLSTPIIGIVDNVMKIKSTQSLREEFTNLLQIQLPANKMITENNEKTILTLQGQQLKKGDKTILTTDDMDVILGRKYLILGENGAGKTTFLLNLLNALFQNKSEQKVGVILQNDAVLDETISQNITFFGASQEIDTAGIVERIGLAKDVNFRVDKNMNNISGGETQKLLYARTIANGCNFLVLDEPFSAVDKEAAEGLIKDILATKHTVFMTSHHINPSLVNLFDYMIFIDGGKLHLSNNEDEKKRFYEKYLETK